jgi:Domain of unknown function (DUF4232)
MWFAVMSKSAAGQAPLACDIGSMRVSFGPHWSEKTQQRTVTVRLTSHAGHACVVDGYPTVSLYNKQGHKLPFTYTHRGDQMVTSHRPKRFILRPGASAYFVLNQQACDQSPVVRAYALRVALRGSADTRRVAPIPRHFPAIYYCWGLPASFRFLTVSPIVRDLADASIAS